MITKIIWNNSKPESKRNSTQKKFEIWDWSKKNEEKFKQAKKKKSLKRLTRNIGLDCQLNGNKMML